MKDTRTYYEELAEKGRKELVRMHGILVGRYRYHDAVLFYNDVCDYGLDYRY